jgi:hypothetical protein
MVESPYCCGLRQGEEFFATASKVFFRLIDLLARIGQSNGFIEVRQEWIHRF